MPFYIIVAIKSIFRDLRRSTTLGVNYLFVAFVLFLLFSITQGVKKNITENVITSTAGHITLSGEYIINGKTYQGIKDFPLIQETILKQFPDTKIITRYTLSSTIYYNGVSKRLNFATVAGPGDGSLRDQINVYSGSYSDFLNSQSGLLLSKEVATYFGLTNSDELLISTRSRFGAFNTATAQISGLYTTGNYFIQDLAICQFDFLQSLDLAEKGTASKIYLFFKDMRELNEKRDLLMTELNKIGYITSKPENSSAALNAVSAASPRNTVLDPSVNELKLTLATVDEVTGILTQVLSAVNGLGIFLVGVMLFVIAVSIYINMRMTINDRMTEIGTLRAIGAEKRDVVKMFVIENVLLSSVFVIAGLLLAWVVIFCSMNFLKLPGEGVLGLFLNGNKLVFQPTLLSAFFITSVLAIFTALFSYFPAKFGGNIPPVVALNKTN